MKHLIKYAIVQTEYYKNYKLNQKGDKSIARRFMCKTQKPRGLKMQVHFHQTLQIALNDPNTNRVKTSRYTLINWVPKSLLIQFQRAANIYFLIISVLTCMPFSPKAPASMIGTFAFVLIFTMFKEAFEDLQRHRQDNELNNKRALVWDSDKQAFAEKPWQHLKSGEMIKVNKDEEFPADIVLIKSDKDSGIVFVDTMNLDGETNLKEKMSPKDLNRLDEMMLMQVTGTMVCDSPNEYLDKWDGNIVYFSQKEQQKVTLNVSPKQLLLRGCKLRNTEYCYGIAVYMKGHPWDRSNFCLRNQLYGYGSIPADVANFVELLQRRNTKQLGRASSQLCNSLGQIQRNKFEGTLQFRHNSIPICQHYFAYAYAYMGPESKIMMNAKKPPQKVSNVQRKMNQMLYSVFAFQLILILLYAMLSIFWIKNRADKHTYLNLSSSPGIVDFIVQYLTYWVAYSHLIPISLYVVLEMIKLGQSKLIGKDEHIFDQQILLSGKKFSRLQINFLKEKEKYDAIARNRNGMELRRLIDKASHLLIVVVGVLRELLLNTKFSQPYNLNISSKRGIFLDVHEDIATSVCKANLILRTHQQQNCLKVKG